ncbi:MAG: ADP-forming succinate--CoA ligase subunit beta [bacterium]|nr:ADP-forming succinate--CoA ligase subunit beta [bacterium]
MKIHEYQAKELLKKYSVPAINGVTIEKLEEAASAIDTVAAEFCTNTFVIKGQIHAGGRGKGGGVKLSRGKEEALENVKNILGMNLVTHQTGPGGQPVKKVLVSPATAIKKEYYAAITMDRSLAQNVFMVSTEGGMDIEEVAAKTPEKIVKEWIKPGFGMRNFQAQRLARSLGLQGAALKEGAKLFKNLYRLYDEMDASIVEINPLVLTATEELTALDAKIVFDENALYRLKEVSAMRDIDEEDPAEVEASTYNLSYIKLNGTVGCMVNGAGLAMATMDIIKQQGGEPANFLDVGGGASVETVKNGFRIILSDPNVRTVLVNIFGGIVRCDRIAGGIIEAVKELDLNVPVVVRLEGTNAVEARKLLAESNVSLISANSLAEAAEKAVISTRAN